MDLSTYIDELRTQLAVAAEAGGEDARALAERLTAPLEPAVRLMLLNALSAAADEITRELAPGSVEVRLRGLDPQFVVAQPPREEAFLAYDRTDGATAPEVDGRPGGTAASPAAPDVDDSGATTSRINLRLPTTVKTRVEQAAARENLSVNTWLVRAVTSTLDAGDVPRRPGRRSGRDLLFGPSYTGQSYTGWVR